MKKLMDYKVGMIAILCMAAAAVIILLTTAGAAGGHVVAAAKDIKKGTVISESNVDELFDLNGEAGTDGIDYITGTDKLAGMIVTEDIPCGASVNMGMVMSEYGPISNIKNPVVMGIHAGEASQFVSGIIKIGRASCRERV